MVSDTIMHVTLNNMYNIVEWSTYIKVRLGMVVETHATPLDIDKI